MCFVLDVEMYTSSKWRIFYQIPGSYSVGGGKPIEQYSTRTSLSTHNDCADHAANRNCTSICSSLYRSIPCLLMCLPKYLINISIVFASINSPAVLSRVTRVKIPALIFVGHRWSWTCDLKNTTSLLLSVFFGQANFESNLPRLHRSLVPYCPVGSMKLVMCSEFPATDLLF